MKMSFEYSEENIKKIQEKGYLLNVTTEEEEECSGCGGKAYLIIPLDLYDGPSYYIEKDSFNEGEILITGEGYIAGIRALDFDGISPDTWATSMFNRENVNPKNILFFNEEGNQVDPLTIEEIKEKS